MNKLRKMVFATSAALLTLTSHSLADGLKVVATFSILGDLAKQVGGDRIVLTTLVGPDSDAHVFEPKPADVAAMAQASVVLVNGLGFEGFIERLASTSGTKATITTASDGVMSISSEQGGVDPHAFQSVSNARTYISNIATAFCTVDAENCDAYKANATAYDKTLIKLDTDIRAAVAEIPQDKRSVITSHDAFGYLAHDYSLVFLAPEGISTDSEASAAEVARLIDQIRTAKASALFVETISDPRLVNQISSETGIKLGGSLYSDALSAPDGPASTYIDMMRYNIATIKGAILGAKSAQ